MGPLPTGECLLLTVDYYSTIVDVVRSTTSSVIIRCLENHFTRHGIPETLMTDNGSNLVSRGMEEFLDELGIKHNKNIEKLEKLKIGRFALKGRVQYSRNHEAVT